jgi:hypothetical protein
VIVSLHLRNIPGRAAAGSYILHSGLSKWNGSEEQAKGVHALAAGAYPVLEKVSAVASNKLAGTALTAFAGSLIGMYLRTPAMRQPGSVWPSQSGIAVSKDVWMVGIGLGLLADNATDRGRKRRTEPSSA